MIVYCQTASVGGCVQVAGGVSGVLMEKMMSRVSSGGNWWD